MAVRLLGISGSLRKGSYNTKLVHEAARLFGECDFTLADIRFPLYDADLEEAEGLPDAVETLIAQIEAADAIVISTPEYNANVSGVLKNALDWISRKKPMPMGGKPVAIMSAAAGRAGGVRSQFSLRHCLTPFRPRVIQGGEVGVAAASKQFDEDGRLTNEISEQDLTRLMGELRAMI
jgi:chromate reductase